MTFKIPRSVFVCVFTLLSYTSAHAYEFAFRVSRGEYPVVQGATDAPDGTAFLVVLKKPWLADGEARFSHGLPACGEDCIPAIDNNTRLMGSRVIVKKGHFTTGPFSFAGKPIPPNTYPIEIHLWIDPKTAPVEDLKKFGTVLFSGEVEITGNSDRNGTSYDGDAAAFYQSRYFLAGYLLRAGRVCKTEANQYIKSAFGLLKTDELKTGSKAYPQNTETWMGEGAGNFNISVMKSGIASACDAALKIRVKAEAMAQTDKF